MELGDSKLGLCKIVSALLFPIDRDLFWVGTFVLVIMAFPWYLCQTGGIGLKDFSSNPPLDPLQSQGMYEVCVIGEHPIADVQCEHKVV